MFCLHEKTLAMGISLCCDLSEAFLQHNNKEMIITKQNTII